MTSQLRATVSGSFQRHMGRVQEAVEALADRNVEVLSPADPRVVDAFGTFVFVASDVRRSILGIQDRHLQAIERSHMLWLVCPDGYIGSSASMELGFAVAQGVPVFSDTPPNDLTLRQYVRVVPDIDTAIMSVRGGTQSSVGDPSLLLDPVATLALAHDELEIIGEVMASKAHTVSEPAESHIQRVRNLLLTPRRR